MVETLLGLARKHRVISVREYADEFRLDGVPEETYDFDRPLVQLGMPGTTQVVIWYARASRGDPAPEVVSVTDGDRPVSFDVSHEPEETTGTGRLLIGGLEADRRYRVIVRVDAAQTVTLDARTAPDGPSEFSFLAFSCLQPYSKRSLRQQAFVSKATRHALWLLRQRATAHEGTPSFALGLGDQVYADDGGYARRNRALVWGWRSQLPRYRRDDVGAFFHVLYRRTFAIPVVDDVLRALPTAMMWDDHDIRDGWGSNHDESEGWRDHLDAARRFFVGYQALRNPTDRRRLIADVADDPVDCAPLHFGFDWGPQATLFVMDLRSQRKHPERVIGGDQLTALTEWLNMQRAHPTLFVLCTPVPLCHEGTWFDRLTARLLPFRRDDVRDAWWDEQAHRTRSAILETLASHFTQAPQDRLLVLSGDAHFSEVLTLSLGDRVFGHEIVSSGLALADYHAFGRRRPERPCDLAGAGGARVGVRGSARFHGPAFAELFVRPRAGAAPQVSVRFHVATTADGRSLVNLDGPTRAEPLPLPVGDGAAVAGKALFASFIGEDGHRGDRARTAAPTFAADDELRAVLKREREAVELRRHRRPEDCRSGALDGGELFGIALSGGGIRAAATSLGFLEALSRKRVLQQADYLSSVSGGSYAAGYLQAVAAESAGGAQVGGLGHDHAFGPQAQQRFERWGRYLAPGGGWRHRARFLRFVAAYLASLALNLTWAAALVLAFAAVSRWLVGAAAGETFLAGAIPATAKLAGAALLLHLVCAPLADRLHRRGLRLAGLFNTVQAAALGSLLALALPSLFAGVARTAVAEGAASICGAAPIAHVAFCDPAWAPTFAQTAWTLGALAVVIGLCAMLNELTMYRFFAARIGESFLNPSQGDGGGVWARWRRSRRARARRLRDLGDLDAPYPLFGACANLLGEKDRSFAGAKTSDHFVFTPHHCGARLTGFGMTGADDVYGHLSLADAVATSAASVTPFMGGASTTASTWIWSAFNLRLDHWVKNPRARHPALFGWLRWWPYYTLRALFGRLDTRQDHINVSDGGFIDNLGVYELLRRRCRLVLALDSTWDPQYDFAHLRNLAIRARHELGLAIEFRSDPEVEIRPRAVDGFSKSHFVVADVKTIAGHPSPWQGLLVYVKTSLLAQRNWHGGDKVRTSRGLAYKTYHPQFPQESTLDQFFDPDQWGAYYELGSLMAAEVLDFDLHQERATPGPMVRVRDLFRRIDTTYPARLP